MNNDFLEATVQRCYDFLYNKGGKCYLLADETGLGKTIETRELIKKIYEEEYSETEKVFRVLYLASNLTLAKRNITKLVFDKYKATEVLETDRLSIEIKEKESAKKIKYLAVTPAVSFFLQGGRIDEKIKLYNKYIVGKRSFPAEISGIYRILFCNSNFKGVKIDDYLNKNLNDDEKKLRGELQKKEEGLLTDILTNDYSKDYKKIVDRILEYTFESRDSYWFKTFLCAEYSKKLVKEYFARIIQEAEKDSSDFNDIMKKVRCKGSTPKFSSDTLKDNVCEIIIAIGGNGNIMQQARQIKKEENLVKYFRVEGDSNEEIIRKNEYLDKNYGLLIRSYHSMNYYICLDGLKTICNGEWGKLNGQYYWLEDETLKKILKDCLRTIIDNDNNCKDLINRLLYGLYVEKLCYYLRLMASIENIRNWKPDLVIFDEFQNYPGILSGRLDREDESENNVRKILDAVSENAKVLMLSATPYAYQNAISVDSDEEDEELNKFLKRVSMEDVLRYLNEQNNKNINHEELFREYHNAVEEFKEAFDDDNNREEKYRKLCEISRTLSRDLLDAGISRNERPISNYSLGEGMLCISAKSVLEQPSDMVITVKGKNDDPSNVRRFLSTPYYNTMDAGVNKVFCEAYDDNSIKSVYTDKNVYKDKNVRIRARVDALLQNIFPGGELPPLFMPHSFSEKIESSISKLISFSAYTNVPYLLSHAVNSRFNELLDEKYKLSKAIKYDTVGDCNCFDSYLNEIFNKYVSDNTDGELGKRIKILGKQSDDETRKNACKSIRKRFENEKAQKIIYIYANDNESRNEIDINATEDGKLSWKNYWEIVKSYCIENQFDEVMDEFLFLYFEEYGNAVDDENNKEKTRDFGLGDYLGANSEDFAVYYTSRPGKNEKDLMNQINSFQSPFFPFCFFLSSVAQEGLDFHWYCDWIVHWNVPSSPVAMLQREGRINRYRCFALRKELISDFKKKYKGEFKAENMKDLFMFAECKKPDYKGNDGFYPNHISIYNKPLSIRRKCYYYPLSEEYFRWKDLIVNMEFYRSLFGGWSDEGRLTDEMIEYIRKREENGEGSIMIDIRPCKALQD